MAKNHDGSLLDSSQNRLIRIYKTVLALMILSTIGSITLNMLLVSNSETTAVENRQWTEFADYVMHLQDIGSKLNAPGNDVFAYNNPDVQEHLLDSLIAVFQAECKTVRNNTATLDKIGKQPEGIYLQLDKISSIADSIHSVSKNVIQAYRKKDLVYASTNMAYMDFLTRDLSTAISEVHAISHNILSEKISSQVHAQSQYSVFENILSTIAFLIIIAGAIYGSKVSGIMRRNALARYEQTKALTQTFEHNQQLIRDVSLKERDIRKLTDAIPGVVYQCVLTPDNKARYLFVSEGARELLGLAPQELLASPDALSKNIFGADVEMVNEAFRKSVRKIGDMKSEFRYFHPNGSLRWIRAQSVTELQTDGSVQWFGILLDITHEKQQNEALAHSEKKLLDMTSAIPGVVYQLQLFPDGRREYLFMSTGTKDLLGMTAEEILDNPFRIAEGIYQDDIDMIREKTSSAMETLTGYQMEFRYRKPDGSIRWINEESVPEKQHDGSVIWSGILTDATERKEQAERIRESEDKLRKITDAIPGAVYQYQRRPNGAGRFIFASAGTKELFGVDSENAFNHKNLVWGRIPREDLEQINQSLDISRKNLTLWRSEFRYHHPNGSLRWFTGIAVPELQPDNSIVWCGVLMDASQQKQQQDALRRSEEMLADAQHIARLGSWEIDVANRSTRWSKQMYDIAGLSPDLPAPTLRALYSRYIHPDDFALIKRYIRSAALASGKFECDIRAHMTDGTGRTLHVIGKPVCDESGRIQKIFGTAMDITERKESEEKLHQANMVIENSTSVIFRWGLAPHWRITYVSGNISQWGYTADEIIGRNDLLQTIVHPDDVERIRQESRLYISNCFERFVLEYRIKTGGSTNTYRWVEERAYVTYTQGVTRSFEGVMTDITERKEAELALSSSIAELRQRDHLLETAAAALQHIVTGNENFHSAMTESIGQIALAMEADRAFIFESRTAKESSDIHSSMLYSWSRIQPDFDIDRYQQDTFKRAGLEGVIQDLSNGNVFRQDIDQLNPVAHRLFRLWKIRSLLIIPIFLRNNFWGYLALHECKQKREWKDYEINVLTGAAASMAGAIERNRTELTLKEYTDYLVEAKSDLEAQAIELQDSNTKLEIARELAESANRAKSAFLSSMSHELRTPLNAILGFTQILRKDTNLRESQQKYVDTMYRSGQHLLSMINDILDISKIEAGHLALQPEQLSIHNFCDDIRAMFHLRCMEKQQFFSVNVNPFVPAYIRADAIRLRQILINLIGNSLKFTPVNGSITVAIDYVASSEDAEGVQHALLHFGVSDTGRGIPENQIRTIFEPFRQVNGMYSEGTGLGLAISSRLCALMGGELKVSSIVGEGSTFWFEASFPVIANAQTHKEKHINPVIGIEKGKDTAILLVDDIPSNREVVKGMLEPLGLTIYEAQDGMECLDMLEMYDIDIVFLDLLMPVMGGEETIRHIRQRSRTKEIPVVAITASGFDGKREAVIQSGFNEYIRKPFREEELHDVLERFTKCVLLRSLTPEEFATTQSEQPADVSLSGIVRSIRALPPQTAHELTEAIETQDFDAIITTLGSIESFSEEEKNSFSAIARAAGENNFRFFVELSNECAMG